MKEVGCPREKSGDLIGHDSVLESDGLGADRVGGTRKGVEGGDRGNGNTEPSVEEVVTGTRDGDGPILSEPGGSGSAGKGDGDLGEPSGTTGLAHEIGGGIETSVHVLFELIVSGKINET